MNEAVVLTPERILEATEDVLRRFGLAKATVVDVARALDVSHGSVYRHFPSKASLRQAVAKRWLDRVNAPLLKIADEQGPAPARLEHWLRTMFAIKHKTLGEDPEMFATYLALAQEACQAVRSHRQCLMDQIAHMLSDGVAQGVFEVADIKTTAPAASTTPPMPRNGKIPMSPRASTPCWRCCSWDCARLAGLDTLSGEACP
jgi:AcrR family transcriptional regulator